MTANAEPITLEKRGSVAVLTLCRPDQRNALSLAMIRALDAALGTVARDATVAVVVLTAEGPTFCAGHDLRELRANPAAAFRHLVFDACADLMLSIPALPQPVIAQVQGPATAAGCQLVAMADLAVAGRSAAFCTPGVNIGLFCSTPSVALSRAVPSKAAMKMLLTGSWIDADEARRIGLVNDVVADDALDNAVLTLARKIAEKPRPTVALGKRTFYQQRDLPLRQAYAVATDAMVENMMMIEAEEGIAAFLEKRPPRWPSHPASLAPSE